MSENKSDMVCYCDEVTEGDIAAAIEQGAKSVPEVIDMTGAMKHCDCANKNPQKT